MVALPTLTASIADFAQALRAAGVPAGPADIIAASQACTCIDVFARPQLRAALAATLVHKADHLAHFSAAFDAFWQAPAAPMAGPAPAAGLAQILPNAQPPEIAFAAAGTASGAQAHRHMDIAAMSASDIAQAKRAVAAITVAGRPRPLRRWQASTRAGRIDLTATWRAALREGGDITRFCTQTRRQRPAKLVVLCDISASMAGYAQVLLHFLHALVASRSDSQVFVFATSLTHVTRALHCRDAGQALAKLAPLIGDFAGGTRIADSLADFNRNWARRVLAERADVVLISDGLDRPDATADVGAGHNRLAVEMARLARNARQIIWLNPLLRYEKFEPRARSVATILAHVDVFRAGHSVASLQALAGLLGAKP